MLKNGKLHCDMRDDCESPVTMLEDKGYIYCTEHGIERRYYHRNRKLRPYELRRLERGEVLAHY